MMNQSEISIARNRFHSNLLINTLTINKDGIVSNADVSNSISRNIAKGIADIINATSVSEKVAGQTSGVQFEEFCTQFIRETFLKINHIRPGNWDIIHVSSRNRLEIAKYDQYSHLIALDTAAKNNPELATALGSDYTITPDIVIVRDLLEDMEINKNELIVDEETTKLARLRKVNGGLPLLHASISCKWTIRSDRAQNARSEALNLIRNRKGKLPHIMVVTAEPTPSRLASLALGTGDIDCVYHFALYELIQTLKNLNYQDASDLLSIMINGNRLKDISDMPLDLAI